MDSISIEPSHGVVGAVQLPADTASRLASLLAAYDAQPRALPQTSEIKDCLKDIPLEAVVAAIECAHPGLAGYAEVRLYRDWIAANDGVSRYAAWFNIGVVLAREGSHEDAAVAYGNALELKPDFCPAANNLGLTLEAMGQTDAALRTWESAIQIDKNRTMLFNHRGRLMEQLGRLDDAETALRTSLLTDFSQPDVIQHWLYIRQKACRWPVLSADIPRRQPAELLRHSGPFSVLALTDDIGVQQAVAASWIARKMPHAQARLSPPEGYHHDRIRVGYLSSDFCRHAMSFLIAELFERHDRKRFEIFGYCASPDDSSDIRRRVIDAFDHYRAIHGLSDEQAASAIRRDEIDILIDLNGLTAGTRLAVLRWKPAPVQATYLGYVGSVPLPELDYLFCDDFVVPADSTDRYSPTPLPIPHLYQANDTKRSTGRRMSRTEAELPEQCFIFCCFSRHYKITEDMFGAWTEILRATGNSVLWLARDSACSEANLRSTAERAGIARDRLIFANRIDPDLYMSRMRLADLFLDTFPYNAGTVASDALRMELPLLTLCGEAFASRMAGSLLTSLNRPEGITTSRAEYIAKAIRLATDADAYRTFRAGFTYVAWAHSVGNIERFTRDFEAVLHDIRLEPIPPMKASPTEPIALHEAIRPGPRSERCLNDLPGADYQLVLEHLHDALHPQTYIEIGVDTGKTLALARCPSIAVDPQFSFVELSCIKQVMAKPSLMLFQTTSDDFFGRFRPDVLFGHSVEFALLDGMHHCENLLRDFINTERCCQVGSIIALHGCLPVELPMANRNPGRQSIDHRRKDMWTGDAWRAALLLKRRRPDLSMVTLDAAPTGLVLITHLDSGSKLLVDCYDECVSEMLSWSLEDMGLAAYHSEMAIQSTHVLDRHEDISRHFGRQTTMPVPTPQEPTLEQTLVEAIEHHHAGRTDEAERLYQTVLASPSAPAIASFSFGLLCATQDRLQEAAAAYRHAIAIKPDFVDAHINLGTVVLALGQREEAVTIFRDAIAISPENAMALGNLGKALQDLGRIDEAIDTYLTAVALKPDDAGIQMNYGAALLDRQAWAESAAVTRHAIALEPDSAMAHVNLGAALFKLGLYEEALVACRRAMALQPESAAILTSLGGVMVELGALPEAEILCRRATILDPVLPNAHLNLSHALMAMNRLDEAEMSVRQAIALRPDAADYHYGLAHILLLKGDMEAGWAEYDWRWKLPAFAARSHILAALSQPLWAGEDIGGKTILIFTEQGLGDMIQYARYLPLVVGKAGRVIVVVAPPVRRLFESIKGITIVSLADTPLSDFDVYCPLLSLPRVLAGEINGVSTGVPYLRADPADQMRWSRRIGGDALRVGIVWAGNPAHKRDRSRSPHLASVMPLFSVPDVDFISLQVGQGREDCDAFPLPPNVLDLGGEVTDLAETAAIMSGLDLMISPDTCPLHLAGALGVQSWAMIPFAPHYPWLLGRTDTPWYPSMRLYRQEQHERDWSSVVVRIATDLAALARSKPKRA